MPDIFEAISHTFNSLVDDEPKPPLTVLEVGACWVYLAFLDDALSISQGALNMTSNADLSGAIHEELKMIQIQKKTLQEFLKNEGIPLPPAAEEKPKSKADDVPPGVKQTDYEIANSLSLKIASAITATATAMAESIRTDVGLMFAQFLGQKMVYAASLKQIMKEHGWIKIPPYYIPPGRPD